MAGYLHWMLWTERFGQAMWILELMVTILTKPLLLCLYSVFQESKTNVNATKDGTTQDRAKLNGDARLFVDIQPVSAAQVKESARHVKNESREQIPFSGPLSVSSSSGFAWARRPQEDRSFARSRTRSSSRGQFPADAVQGCNTQAKENAGLRELPSRDIPVSVSHVSSRVRDRGPHDAAKRAVLKKWSQLEHPDSFDSCDTYHSHNFSNAMFLGGTLSSKNGFKVRWDSHLLDTGSYFCYIEVVANVRAV